MNLNAWRNIRHAFGMLNWVGARNARVVGQDPVYWLIVYETMTGKVVNTTILK